MAFDLEVSFTGLCAFLIQKDCKRVAVVQPDCRNLTGSLSPMHPDGDPVPGLHHVGFLAYNLASLVSGFPPGDPDNGPAYEVVHRLTGEVVNFGLPDVDDPMAIETLLPAMERVAPVTANPEEIPEEECGHADKSLLKPMDGLFGSSPPLVMRTIFSGGSLRGSKTSNFEFLRLFNPQTPTRYAGDFARKVTWRRRVEDANELNLTLSRFDGSDPRTITLKPVPDIDDNPVISLKLSNLCADNPLEWPECGTPEAAVVDRDFKWLYRLFVTVANGQPAQTLLPTDTLFPVPMRPTDRGPQGGENCIGTRITVDGF